MTRIVMIMLIMMFTLSVLSAGTMYIHLFSNETQEFGISEISELTFVDDGLNIHLLTGETEVFPIAEIAKITFSEDLSVEELVDIVSEIPVRFLKNYPNPFNPETTISFEIVQAGRTKVEIYNAKGQRVRVLLDEIMQPGSHTILWNGRNEENNQVSSGVYFYRVSVDESEKFSKMIMIK